VSVTSLSSLVLLEVSSPPCQLYLEWSGVDSTCPEGGRAGSHTSGSKFGPAQSLRGPRSLLTKPALMRAPLCLLPSTLAREGRVASIPSHMH
jgi:hypothetical protein